MPLTPLPQRIGSDKPRPSQEEACLALKQIAAYLMEGSSFDPALLVLLGKLSEKLRMSIKDVVGSEALIPTSENLGCFKKLPTDQSMPPPPTPKVKRHTATISKREPPRRGADRSLVMRGSSFDPSLVSRST